jgi:hypothetical protein
MVITDAFGQEQFLTGHRPSGSFHEKVRIKIDSQDNGVPIHGLAKRVYFKGGIIHISRRPFEDVEFGHFEGDKDVSSPCYKRSLKEFKEIKNVVLTLKNTKMKFPLKELAAITTLETFDFTWTAKFTRWATRPVYEIKAQHDTYYSFFGGPGMF